MFQGMLAVERAAAQAEVLEGVIADFFRLYLAAENSSAEEVHTALGMLSEKLLAQQAHAMQAKDTAMQAVQDLKAARAEERRQLEEFATAPVDVEALIAGQQAAFTAAWERFC